jgi:hypothetical protein
MFGYQHVMGVTFTAMGLGTMMFPVSGLGLFIDPSIHAYCFTGNEVNPVAKLLWQCFGAQATLCGVLILSCKFTKKTFRNFGLAIIPFFAFDYLAYRAGYITLLGAVGDLIGNIVFTTLSYLGYHGKAKNK